MKQRSAMDELTNSETSDSSEANGYKAFKEGRRNKSEIMLRLHYKNNKKQFIHYFEIRDILIENDDSLINIIRPHEVITIKGKNFSSVLDALQQNKIHTITEFNPKTHNQVTQTNLPFIEEIKVSPVE